MTRKEEILRTACSLFMDYGIRSVTMDDLAKELNISKKTLYQEFSDKATLVKEIAQIELQKISEGIEKILSESLNAIERMIKINIFLIDMKKRAPKNVKYDLSKYYPKISKKLLESVELQMFKAVVRNHKQGIAEGFIRKEINPEIIATLQVIRANYSKTISEFLEDYDDEEILREVFDYHIRGIATPEGLAFYEENYDKTKIKKA